MKCKIHHTEMDNLIDGYNHPRREMFHLGWYCSECKKQYNDAGEVIGEVL